MTPNKQTNQDVAKTAVHLKTNKGGHKPSNLGFIKKGQVKLSVDENINIIFNVPLMQN